MLDDVLRYCSQALGVRVYTNPRTHYKSLLIEKRYYNNGMAAIANAVEGTHYVPQVLWSNKFNCYVVTFTRTTASQVDTIKPGSVDAQQSAHSPVTKEQV